MAGPRAERDSSFIADRDAFSSAGLAVAHIRPERPAQGPRSMAFMPGEKYTAPEALHFSMKDYAREAREGQILKGKKILVYATGGIGEATALELAAEGATVIIAGRLHADNSKNERLVESLKALGSVDSFFIPADFSSAADRERLLGLAQGESGRFDGLIVTAGVTHNKLLTQFTEEEIIDDVNVNFTYPSLLIKETARIMANRQKQPRTGKILAMSSVSAVGNGGQVPYSASKAALDAFVIGISKEYKEKLSINNIAPGLVKTEMISDLTPEQITALNEFLGADRELTAEEVAVMNAFMMSDRANVTGKIVSILGIDEEPVADEHGLLALAA